jgi:hypothetical protein
VGDPYAELGNRWRHARRAALRASVPGATDGDPDEKILAEALAADPEAAAKQSFENSLALGKGFVRHHSMVLEASDLPEVARALDYPCLQGRWSELPDGDGLRLERAGCPLASLGPHACRVAYESVLGLVLGVTETLGVSRHEAVTGGSASCVDVFHERLDSAVRFAPIPPEMGQILARIQRSTQRFDSSVQVSFLGLSEGVLLYRVTGGMGHLSVSGMVERSLARHLPGLRIKEHSPRAVITT